MAWTTHLVDSLLETQVKQYEARCQEYNEFREAALRGAAERLGSLSQDATNINVKLPLEPDERAESSRARWRIYEATKSIMEDIKHGVADGATLRLQMEQKPTPPLNRNSLLPVPTQGAEEATQRASKEPENQAADSGPKKEKAPGKTNKPSKHSRTSDTESDEEVASRNARKKRKQESSLAKQSRSNTDGGDIDIEDVEEAFIFEYPHNSSLLWIVRCALCDFSPKRHPLIFTTSAFMHWNARGHPNVTAQDLLESHLVRVVGGSVRKATAHNKDIGARGKECQARRREVSRYTTPKFMDPLLPNNHREPRAGSSHHSDLPSRQLELRPRPPIREPQAAYFSVSQRPPAPQQQPEPADASAANRTNATGPTNLPQQPLSRAPAIEGPTNDNIVVNTSPPEDNARSATLSPGPSASRSPTDQREPSSESPNSRPPQRYAKYSARGGPRWSYSVLDQTGGRGRDIA